SCGPDGTAASENESREHRMASKDLPDEVKKRRMDSPAAGWIRESPDGSSNTQDGTPVAIFAGRKRRTMSTIHLHQTTTSTPEQFIAGLTDFGPGRSKLFGNSTDDYLRVHHRGPSDADVTEGSNGIWERLNYDAVLGIFGGRVLGNELAKTVKGI